MSDNFLTLLSISGIDLPPYATRDITQSLEPIQQAKQTRRTVDGVLRDISAPQFQKYKSTITCTDQQDPSLDGIWPGKQVTVDHFKFAHGRRFHFLSAAPHYARRELLAADE
jgi:hypothetical protein